MDTKQETVHDIAAEMRAYDNTPPPKRAWLDLADRIEAAVRSDIAAIRIALFRATEMLDQVYKHSGLTPSMRESIAEAVRDADAVLKGTPPPPKRFDEAAFDAAVSKPNGWSDVADPVAEIRRMRDGNAPGNAAALREALVEILDRTNREKARDYDAALNGGILEIHDIANTALNHAQTEQPSNAAAMRDALKRILAIEGYGAPWIEAKCIAKKALECEQCTPPIAKETAKIEQPGNAAAQREALEKIARWDDGIGADISNIARAALAAPARNVDRFKTAEEALDAFIREKEIKAEDVNGMNLRDFFDWLFATAEVAHG